eukprot:TRINITY_DN20604_c0_g1_i5.p1 TRINITY_DN20604_c0_g1~~TRINITY_DN20604_c0_g1_i5.p1  ORF type:complete len:421 (-),score=94.93 TRINITY_DN20604_c0_g1_i5:236-1498(-)
MLASRISPEVKSRRPDMADAFRTVTEKAGGVKKLVSTRSDIFDWVMMGGQGTQALRLKSADAGTGGTGESRSNASAKAADAKEEERSSWKAVTPKEEAQSGAYWKEPQYDKTWKVAASNEDVQYGKSWKADASTDDAQGEKWWEHDRYGRDDSSWSWRGRGKWWERQDDADGGEASWQDGRTESASSRAPPPPPPIPPGVAASTGGAGDVGAAGAGAPRDELTNSLVELLKWHGGTILASQLASDLKQWRPEQAEYLRKEIERSGGLKRYAQKHSDIFEWILANGTGTEALRLIVPECDLAELAKTLVELIKENGGMLLASKVLPDLRLRKPSLVDPYRRAVEEAGGLKKLVSTLRAPETIEWMLENGPGTEALRIRKASTGSKGAWRVSSSSANNSSNNANASSANANATANASSLSFQ